MSDHSEVLRMTTSNGRCLLLVEDNEDDVVLFNRALRKAGIAVQFVHAEDGQRALDYMGAVGEFQDRLRYPTPSLVLLDLKLPHRDGHEVLQWARSSQEFDRVCFVMLTSSGETSDVERAFAAGANDYLTKPISPETLRELWTILATVWPSTGPRSFLNLSQSERPRSLGRASRERPAP